MSSPLQGRWRIIEMELWDQDAMDAVAPAFIELRVDGSGSFGFIVVSGAFYYPLGPSHFLVDWGGSDECEPACGELDAELRGQQLVGSISLGYPGEGGDESEFVARRWDNRLDGEP